jgi:hypothetical protein
MTEKKVKPEPTIADLQKEIVDLKIRVNNLEKMLSRLSKPKKEDLDWTKLI